MAGVTDNHDDLSSVLKANFAVFRGSGYRICSERYSMTFWLLFNVYFEKFDKFLTKLCAPVVVVRNVRFDNVTVSCQMVRASNMYTSVIHKIQLFCP